MHYELTNKRRYAYKKLVDDALKRKQAELGKEKPLNQKEIADMVGISQSTISALLNGPSPAASYFNVSRLLQWLEIPPNEAAKALGLYGKEEEEEEPPLSNLAAVL